MANNTFFTNEHSLRLQLRYLMLTYTPQEVHTTLQSIFLEDYAFYNALYAVAAPVPVAPLPVAPVAPVPVAPVPVAQAPAVEEQSQDNIPRPPKTRPDMKIRIVKKAAAPLEIPTPPPTEPVIVEVSSEKEKKSLIKKELAEKIAEKNAELLAAGVEPVSLLTKANLKGWLEDDGLAYTDIARDHVGLPTDQIASIAKGHGLQSPFSLKRKAIMFSTK